MGLILSQWIVGLCDQLEFPPFSRGHWQSTCTALMAGKMPAIRAVQGDCERVYHTGTWQAAKTEQWLATCGVIGEGGFYTWFHITFINQTPCRLLISYPIKTPTPGILPIVHSNFPRAIIIYLHNNFTHSSGQVSTDKTGTTEPFFPSKVLIFFQNRL